MAGVQAGRLNIEIVAEIARLQTDLDKAKRAVKAASNDIAASAKHANDNLANMGAGAKRATPGLTGMGSSGKLAAHHLQNLSFQANDLFVGLASGQKPMTVFMQQGTQIAQIMGQAGVGVGGLTKAVGGMVVGFAKAHPVITAVVAAVGAASAALAIFTSQVNAQRSAELQAYANSLGLTKEEMEKLGPASITAGDAIKGVWAVIKEGLGLDKVFTHLREVASFAFQQMLQAAKISGAGIYAAFAGGVDAIKTIWRGVPAVIGEATTGAANLAIAGIEKLINSSIDALNSFSNLVNKVLGTSIGGISHINLGRIESQWAGAGKAMADGVLSGYEKRFAEGMRGMDAIGNRLSDAITDAAKDRLARSAADIIDDRTEKKLKDKAGKAGKAAGDKLAEELLKTLKQLQNDVLAAFVDINKRTMDEFTKRVNEDWAALVDEVTRGANTSSDAFVDWNEELRKTVDLLDQIGGMGGKLGDIGAVLVGLTSGDFSGVRGPAGTMISQLLKFQWQDPADANGRGTIHVLRDEIVQGLDKVFGGSGTFAKTMTSVLQGAGTGAAIGSIVFGGSKAGQFGSAIGGAAGQAIGGAIKALGNFGGPIGSIVGAIAGGLLGSALSSTKRGSATFNTEGLVGTRGNSSSRIAGAKSAGDSILDAFDQLLDQLGATASGVSFSTGIRKKNFVLDPSGQGRTKGSGVLNFGQDEEAFLKAIMQEIISDATFEGLSEGFNNYLKTGAGDIADRIQDVLGLKGALDELRSLKDPEGFALEGLDKEFAKLREIAQATGEGLVEIEELYGLRRKDIVEQYAAEALEKERERRELEIEIMALEGDAAGALAAARQLELEATDASLRPLMERIFALQDEAVAAAEAARVADERAGLQIRLAEALGNEEEVLRLRRDAELAAVDALNLALLQQIHTAEDAATAAAKLASAQAQAAAQAAAAMQEHANLQIRLADASGDTGLATLLRREQELAGAIDGASRALLAQIYAAEDKAAKAVPFAAQPALNQSKPDTLAARLQQSEELAAAAAAREEEQRSKLTEAYERERKAFEDAAEAMRQVSDALKGYRDELLGNIRSPAQNFQRMQMDLIKAGASTDPAVLAGIPGMSRTFLELAERRSSTPADFARQQAFAIGILNQAIGTADEQVSHEERQLDALNRSVDGIDGVRKETEELKQTVKELLAETKGLRSENTQLLWAIEGHAAQTDKKLGTVTRGGRLQTELD